MACFFKVQLPDAVYLINTPLQRGVERVLARFRAHDPSSARRHAERPSVFPRNNPILILDRSVKRVY
jgi:hypothetical protein